MLFFILLLEALVSNEINKIEKDFHPPLSSILNQKLIDESEEPGGITLNMVFTMTVEQCISLENAVFNMVGDGTGGIIGVGGSERGAMLVMANCTTLLKGININTGDGRIIAEVTKGGTTKVQEVNLEGFLKTEGLFIVNDGTISIEAVSYPKNTEIGGIIIEGELGSSLNVMNQNIENCVVCLGNELFFSQTSIIDSCTIKNLSRSADPLKRRKGKLQEVKRSTFEGCEDVISGNIMNSFCYSSFSSEGNNYIKNKKKTQSEDNNYVGSMSFTSDLFELCSTDYAGGAVEFLGKGSLIVTDCTFNNCTSKKDGGALYVKGLSSDTSMDVSKNVFSGCLADVKGGAIACYKGNLAVTECNFNDCSAYSKNGYGGAIFGVNFDVFVQKTCNFTGCTCGYCGGAECLYSVSENYSLTIDECNYNLCNCSYCGGGLYIHNGTVVINSTNMNKCTVFGSTASGGAVCYKGKMSLTLENDNFVECNSNYYGGAVGFYSTEKEALLSLKKCSFNSCQTKSSGGAVSVKNGNIVMNYSSFLNCSIYNFSGIGGAISYLSYSTKVNNISYCNFTKCNTFSGGAIFFDVVSGPMNLSYCRFDSNEATSGGAVYVDNGLTNDLTFDHCKFMNNNDYYGNDIYACHWGEHFNSSSFIECTSTSNISVYDYTNGKEYSLKEPLTDEEPSPYPLTQDYHDDSYLHILIPVLVCLVVLVVLCVSLLVCCCYHNSKNSKQKNKEFSNENGLSNNSVAAPADPRMEQYMYNAPNNTVNNYPQPVQPMNVVPVSYYPQMQQQQMIYPGQDVSMPYVVNNENMAGMSVLYDPNAQIMQNVPVQPYNVYQPTRRVERARPVDPVNRE